MFRFLLPYKKEFILGPFFKLIEAVLELMLPTMTAFIIDKGIVPGNRNEILKWGVIMLFSAATGFGSAIICQFYASRASQGLGTDLRNALFEKIMSFSYRETQKLSPASLTNRIIVDTGQIQAGAAMVIRLLIRAPFLCIGGIVMAVVLNPKLSLLFIGLIMLTALLLGAIIAASVSPAQKTQQKLDGLTVRLRQNLSGVRVIRAFSAEERETEAFEENTAAHARMASLTGYLTGITGPATTLLLNLGIIGVIGFGGWQVRQGTMSRGEIVALVNYFIMILNAFIVVSNLAVLFSKTAASTARVKEILEFEPALPELPAGPLPEPKPGQPLLEFENVTFRYTPEAAPALERISFKIFPGNFIGIIGGTGSGKSTLADLMQRFDDVTEGRILLCGTDIRTLPPAAVRQFFATVPQQKTLFAGTVSENLRWGNPTATDEEIAAACRAARAEEFINALPNGYDTFVERGGVNFSGGQRQRLTIARAFLKPAPLLILDDAFSALDAVTASAIRAEIESGRKNRTVVIVSQRARMIRDADLILVLENGKTAGIGTHAELMKSCSVYKEITASQEVRE